MVHSAFRKSAHQIEAEYRAMTPAERIDEFTELHAEFLGYHDNILETLDCQMLEECFKDTQNRMRILGIVMADLGEQVGIGQQLPSSDHLHS